MLVDGLNRLDSSARGTHDAALPKGELPRLLLMPVYAMSGGDGPIAGQD